MFIVQIRTVVLLRDAFNPVLPGVNLVPEAK
jgi:hypothetical protein